MPVSDPATGLPAGVVPMFFCLTHGRTTRSECCGQPTRPMFYCVYCDSFFARENLTACLRCGKRLYRHRLKLNPP